MFRAPEDEIRRIDEALQAWGQGDCILGEHWFVYRFSPTHPLTEEAAKIAADTEGSGVDLAESEVRGLMVASQSCDIVRSCADRPFVEVCPLVELPEEVLREAERGRRPRFAYIPGVAPRRLAADLDRVMTIEKSIVATWERTPGCEGDAARRSLAVALARKRVRFAFPDDFAALARKLQSRLGDKHDKNSDEGRGLRALREIRIRAAPSWGAPRVELFFWFIRNDDAADFEGKSWAKLLEDWLKLVPASGRFRSVDVLAVALADLTARDYVESDPLDLDHLSTRED